MTAMAFGAALNRYIPDFEYVESWVSFSVLALGLILWRWRMPPIGPAALLAAVFAVGHGYVHGAEIGDQSDAVS